AVSIDGVLVRSSDALPRAHKTLSYLQSQRIPFILLTNGGGKHESIRVADLSSKLGLDIDISMFVQSHTPFADMDQYKDKTVMVVGGEADDCRKVAEAYGFKTVVTPADVLVSCPEIWPFSQHLLSYYSDFARPLPAPIDPSSPSTSLRIDAVFVYNDPRDWGLDAQIIKDVLLSTHGILGTLSSKNGDKSLPNNGYQQDGQPVLFFSNPDLLWAAKYSLPRLGQGGFREALEGIWAAITGGPVNGVYLHKTVMGKPYKPTYEFAEKRLLSHRRDLIGGAGDHLGHLKSVYMVGDNPASDIAGGNNYESPYGTDWKSVLVETGVFVKGTTPAYLPRKIVSKIHWNSETSTPDSQPPPQLSDTSLSRQDTLFPVAGLALAPSSLLFSTHYLSATSSLQSYTFLSATVLDVILQTRFSALEFRNSRRAPAVAHTISGRLPVGTPTTGDNTSHCHIRVVPRADNEPSQLYDSDSSALTPVFRSLSLLCPATTMSKRTPASQDLPIDSLAQARSFADMARRVGIDITDGENESLVQTSASAAGMIKLQPHRAREHKAWQPARNNDLGKPPVSGRGGGKIGSAADAIPCFQPHSSITTPSHLAPTQQHPVQGYDAGWSVASSTLGQRANYENPSEGSDDNKNGVATVEPAIGGWYTELFGKLPDPIHLHEHLGEFDGQVQFIGHPNRDISAHQWSLASFQWETIGRYTQVRGRIEGPLASDQPKKYANSHSALGHFKVVAENRERFVVDNGRPCQTAVAITLPTLPEVVRNTKPASILEPSTGGISPVPFGAKVRRELLNDPFLADTRPFEVVDPSHSLSESQIAVMKGSLDLEYEFPIKPAAFSRPSENADEDIATRGRYMQREELTTSQHRTSAPGLRPHLTLRDVSFGEEASSRRAPQGIRSLVSVCKKRPTYPDPPAQDHNDIPRYGAFQATARSLFPTNGLTVANPHRGSSRPDITTMGCRNQRSQEVNLVTNNEGIRNAKVAKTAMLRFSDPDGIRQGQEHEIANGLSQQAPTSQKFKGPFFTGSKPTANDPTVSLSTHISEEEKLITWFHDGHRPARQREHAMTLVSAEIAGGKSQWGSAINDSVRATHKSDFKNTAPFVRLYEGLSEYMEEYHKGGGGSYFSRAWRAASSQMRDFDADGNSSYFIDATETSSRHR
ncbi:HAD-superfamily hydrolase, partial [Ophiobolus disseminans]